MSVIIFLLAQPTLFHDFNDWDMLASFFLGFRDNMVKMNPYSTTSSVCLSGLIFLNHG